VYKDVEVASVALNLVGHFSPIISPFADIGLSRRLTWSASGDERENQKSGTLPAPQTEKEAREPPVMLAHSDTIAATKTTDVRLQ
jgi:hypothetical protein